MRRPLTTLPLLSVLSVLPAAAVALTLAAPAAHAGSRTFADSTGEVPRSQDITRYTVLNGATVGVRTFHRNLTAKAVDIQMWVDVPATSSAWDYLVFSDFAGRSPGIYRSDFTPVACKGVVAKRNVKRDWARLTVPRTCLGLAAGDKVRLRVRVQNDLAGSTGDTAPSDTGYSRWVG